VSLQLLLDSADPITWQTWFATGLFAGITTNPSLLRRANQPCKLDHLKLLALKAEQIGYRELHLQAWGNDANELAECGTALAQLTTPGLTVQIKLPITQTGSQAARTLIAAEIPVTFTACYEAPQVLIAAALGAKYIAPYLGRINDQGRDGYSELVAMQRALDGVGSSCKLLVASLRHSNDLSYLAAEGINTFTISPVLAAELFDVEATLKAAEAFEKDARLN
jgi:transaldolase|tara:strand:- start:286 stop:954 length:669 start_codon:yes stop_codon:yes gene_type:complete